MKTDALSVRAVTTLEEFETLAGPWNALLRQAGVDNVFLTWEWLYTWAKHYLGADRLWIALVYREPDRLVGIAPFFIRRGRAHGIPLRDLRFLGSDEVCSAYLDFIVSRRDHAAVVSRLYRYLHEEVSAIWDTVTLPEIPAGSSTIDLWDRLIQDAGKVVDVVATTACPVMELPARAEDLTERMGAKARYNLLRSGKRLEQAGRVVYERVASEHEVQEALATFIQLHQKRWVKTAPGGAFASPRFLAFHQEIAKVFSELGWLRLDFLRLNGEAIAGVYGYSYRRRYSFYLPGFDPAVLPRMSPGILLLLRCAGEAVREGDRQFDLLQGVADYKMVWADRLERCLTLRHYNHNVRASAAKLLASGRDAVKALVR